MKKLLILLFSSVTFIANSQVVKYQTWDFQDDVIVRDTLRLPTGAAAGKVLTADATGASYWETPGAGVVMSVTHTLDSNDIRAIKTFPDTLVPAQGTNTAIIPIRVVYYYAYNSIPYATDVSLRVEMGGNNILLNSGILSNTNNNFSSFTIGNYAQTATTIDYINKPLLLTTPTANPTAGNSPVTITVLYSIVNL